MKRRAILICLLLGGCVSQRDAYCRDVSWEARQAIKERAIAAGLPVTVCPDDAAPGS